MIGWIIFRVESLSEIVIILNNIFTFKSSDYVEFFANNYSLINYLPYMVLAFVGCTPIVSKLYNKFENMNKLFSIIFDLWLLFILMLSVVFLLKSTYNSFIYFRF